MKKMICKRFLSLFLVLVMILQMPIEAFAADEGSEAENPSYGESVDVDASREEPSNTDPDSKEEPSNTDTDSQEEPSNSDTDSQEEPSTPKPDSEEPASDETVEVGSLKIKKNVTVNGEATTGTSADGTYTFEVKDKDGNVKATPTVTITNGVSEERKSDV